MRRPRLPGGAPISLARSRRAALSVALFVLLAALVLLSDLRAQPTAAAAQNAWLTACANGTVVPEPAASPALVADCAALLESRDALHGTTVLNLQRAGLDGVIPAALGRLTGLRELRVSSHDRLTGPIQPGLGRLANLRWLAVADMPMTPVPTCNLTVTAGEGGSAEPAGTTTHTEGEPVTLTAG